MNKFIYVVIIGALWAMSCSENATPLGVVSVNKMSMILRDIHYFEAESPSWQDKDSIETYLNKNYQFVFNKYGVDRQDWENSIDYYIKNPEKFDKVYQLVIDSMNLDLMKKE